MPFEEDETRIEVAPLLDVAFIALAVLALAAARGPDLTMLPAGLPVLGVAADRPVNERIVVSFDADGTFRVNGESVPAAGLSARVADLRESAQRPWCTWPQSPARPTQGWMPSSGRGMGSPPSERI